MCHKGDSRGLQGSQQATVRVPRATSHRPQRGHQQATQSNDEQSESHQAQLTEHVDPLIVGVHDDDRSIAAVEGVRKLEGAGAGAEQRVVREAVEPLAGQRNTTVIAEIEQAAGAVADRAAGRARRGELIEAVAHEATKPAVPRRKRKQSRDYSRHGDGQHDRPGDAARSARQPNAPGDQGGHGLSTSGQKDGSKRPAPEDVSLSGA